MASLNRSILVMLESPDGFLFSEPLSKTGSSDRTQIYGEISLGYEPGIAYVTIRGLTTGTSAVARDVRQQPPQAARDPRPGREVRRR
ncbi:hypothetical protein ACFV4N_21855 [Actinosynnema sp. NPDC059797]